MERKASEFKNSLVIHEEEENPSSFFKIMIVDFKDHLFIPPIFACTIGDLIKQTVFLRDSSGQSWRVKFSMINGRLAFQEGWPDFVLGHSITLGELLVFRYRGHSTFDIEIFGTNACIRKNFDVENKESSTKSNRKMTEVHHEIQVYRRRETSDVSKYRCKVAKCDAVDKVRKEKSSHRMIGNNINRASHNIHENEKLVPTKIDVENKESSTKSKRKIIKFHKKHVYKKWKTSDVSEHRCKVENHDLVDKVRKEKSSYRVTGKEVNQVSHNIHEKKKSVPTKLEGAPLKLNYTRALNDAIEEDDEEHKAIASPSDPLCASECDRVNKDFPRSHSLEQKCAQNSTENLINFEEVVGRFLLKDDGVCHIYDEEIMNETGASVLGPNDMLPSEKENRVCEKEKVAMSKPIIDLTKAKDRNCRSNSKKIRKKPQGKGTLPVVISRVENDVPAKHVGSASQNTTFQKHHKRPHIATGYSCQSGQVLKRVKEEINPCFKGKTIQVKTEPMDGLTLAPPAFANVRFSLYVSAQTSWIKLPVKLPSQFGRAKHSRKIIQLRDPSMRLWPILYHEDIKFVGFIGGWEHFARGNKLQEGDHCEFEIAEGSESTLQVHTVRARDLVPLSSSKCTQNLHAKIAFRI